MRNQQQINSTLGHLNGGFGYSHSSFGDSVKVMKKNSWFFVVGGIGRIYRDRLSDRVYYGRVYTKYSRNSQGSWRYG